MPSLSEVKINSFSEEVFKGYRKSNPALFRILASEAQKINQPVIHINSTAVGGGVAEMLQSWVPFERTLGIDSHWLVMDAPPAFFAVTKKIHNLLQGKMGSLTKEEKDLYLGINNNLAGSLSAFLSKFKNGAVFIHDPQPLPLIKHIPGNFSKILRLHIDLSLPNKPLLNFLKPFISDYPLVVLSNREYFPSFSWLPESRLKIIYPAIDPLTDKNRELELETARQVVTDAGINPLKPIIAQISRFDFWKDPVGVIRAFYLAQKEIPDLQLVLVGFSRAQDDPESELIFNKVKRYAKGDPNIFLFYDPAQLGDCSEMVFISAVHAVAEVIIQASIREGFGLTITEAMWKGKSVVARRTSGSDLQIDHLRNGFLSSFPDEAAGIIIKLLRDKTLRRQIGRAARKTVKEKFLLPRLVLDSVKLYLSAKPPIESDKNSHKKSYD